MEAKLSLKDDLRLLNPALKFGYEYCINAGLDKESALEFILAFDELLSDVIQFAYPEEEGEIEITFRNNLSEVEAVIQEFGEPFDPEKHRFSKEKFIKEGSFEGAGLEVIKHFVDNFIFMIKGKAGKEFRLVKNIRHPHITEMFKPEGIKKEEPVGVSYKLFPVKPEDAEDIAKLIYRAYGYTYPKEDMYYPAKIKEALRAGQKFGVIVKTERGETVGYFAVLMSTDSNIGEVGEVVVSPKHRGKGLMTMMMNALIDMAKEKGLLGLFGEAVTVHTISQKVNAKFGFKSTALLLGMFPYIEYKGFDVRQPRISVVIDFLPLVKREKAKIYAPAKYKNILEQIYKNLGINLSFGREKAHLTTEKSNLKLDISFKYQNALIVVNRYGKDFFSRIEKNLKSLKDKKIEAIFIDLPLDNPYTRTAVDRLNELGFIFGGVMPLFHKEKDFLRLQYVTLDFDSRYVYVYSDMAKKIKNKVFREYKRWLKNRTTS
ncbi:MAG: GNAT family N-acetyltransferase [Aquificae bacterium]|nr:GNAT family N-acetyltransferase [Aquificota bacterium]